MCGGGVVVLLTWLYLSAFVALLGAVINAQAPDLEEFLDMLGDCYPRRDILVGDVGPVIGTHSGPRAVGVTFHVPR